MAKSKVQIAFERKEGYVEIRAENLSVRVDKNVKITSMTVRYLAVPKRSEKAVLFGSLDVALNEILTLYGVRIVKAKVGGEMRTFLAPMSRKGKKGRIQSARLEDELQSKILEQARSMVQAYLDQLKAQQEAAAAKA